MMRIEIVLFKIRRKKYLHQIRGKSCEITMENKNTVPQKVVKRFLHETFSPWIIESFSFAWDSLVNVPEKLSKGQGYAINIVYMFWYHLDLQTIGKFTSFSVSFCDANEATIDPSFCLSTEICKVKLRISNFFLEKYARNLPVNFTTKKRQLVHTSVRNQLIEMTDFHIILGNFHWSQTI